MHHYLQSIRKIKKEKLALRSFQLWVILLCALALTLIGLYLFVQQKFIIGKSFSGKYGNPGSQVSISGISTILIGLVISIFPTCQLIKQSTRSKMKK